MLPMKRYIAIFEDKDVLVFEKTMKILFDTGCKFSAEHTPYGQSKIIFTITDKSLGILKKLIYYYCNGFELNCSRYTNKTFNIR